MSARVLFACWPFVPHVYPQLSIAVALRERGSDVAFYSGEDARAAVEGEGFRFFAFERVQAERWLRVQSAEAQTRKRAQSARISRQAARDWLVETIPDQVADLAPVFERWRPDVVACDVSMWGPIVILWESTGVPVAVSSTLMGPMIPGPDAPPWGLGLKPPRSRRERLRARALTRVVDVAARGLRRRVDELRAEHGLPPMGRSVNEFTGRLPLYLVGNVRELDYGRRDLPPAVQYVGPCIWHPPAEPGSLAWLDAVPTADPWVHVTEGTSHQQDAFVLRAAAQGLAGAPVQAILTTGRQRDPDRLDLGPTAPNVHVARWVAHDELLPRCAAVVTTGGAATIIASLKAGAPLVIVPTTWDKPDNARRVVEAGAGVRLKPRDCTARALRGAVDQVLADPSYLANARRIAERLAKAPGPTRAAALLEQLARGRRPRPTTHLTPDVASPPSEASQLEGSR